MRASVAPPELEGHILELKDISDVCIVGKPDEYSGEVPFAFIVPSADALERIKKEPAEADKIKAAVIKVCETCSLTVVRQNGLRAGWCSTSRTTRCTSSASRAASSSLT